MIRRPAAALFAGALAIAAVAAPFAANAQAAPELEVLTELPGGPGNITVTPDGLVVVSVHPFFDTPGDVAMAVTQDGAFSWFPGRTDTQFGRVLSVRADADGNVWMMSMGGGAARITIVDATTGELQRTIEPESPGSSFNDMALALEEGVVVISDPGAGGALSILDVESETVRRVLVGHPSVSAEDVLAPIDGIPLGQRGPDGEISPMRSGINPITIDSDLEWVYYGAMTGASLYRVRLSDLLDESLSEDALGERVERYGDKAPSAGITIDEAGNVYVADIGARGVGVTAPDGSYRVLVQDDVLIDWPDGLAVGSDGYVYIAANGLHRNFPSHAHLGPAEAPFPLARFKALAETRAGR